MHLFLKAVNGTTLITMDTAIIGLTLHSTIAVQCGESVNMSAMPRNLTPVLSLRARPSQIGMAALIQTQIPFLTAMKTGPLKTVQMPSLQNRPNGKILTETVGATTKQWELNSSMISRSTQRSGRIPMMTDGVITKPTVLLKSMTSHSSHLNSETVTGMAMVIT